MIVGFLEPANAISLKCTCRVLYLTDPSINILSTEVDEEGEFWVETVLGTNECLVCSGCKMLHDRWCFADDEAALSSAQRVCKGYKAKVDFCGRQFSFDELRSLCKQVYPVSRLLTEDELYGRLEVVLQTDTGDMDSDLNALYLLVQSRGFYCKKFAHGYLAGQIHSSLVYGRQYATVELMGPPPDRSVEPVLEMQAWLHAPWQQSLIETLQEAETSALSTCKATAADVVKDTLSQLSFPLCPHVSVDDDDVCQYVVEAMIIYERDGLTESVFSEDCPKFCEVCTFSFHVNFVDEVTSPEGHSWPEEGYEQGYFYIMTRRSLDFSYAGASGLPWLSSNVERTGSFRSQLGPLWGGGVLKSSFDFGTT
jgi:hypothetical protein